MMNSLKKLYESFRTIAIHESVYDFFLLVQFFFICKKDSKGNVLIAHAARKRLLDLSR